MSDHNCYHCAEPVPANSQFIVDINQQPRNMCCPGCAAVAQSIVDNGLASYYDYRTSSGAKTTGLVPEQLSEFASYDIQEIQEEFVQENDNQREILLTVENVTCAACAWLIERQLYRMDGLSFCNVNTTTARITVRWQPDLLKLSTILTEIARVGYKAYPFQADKEESRQVALSKSYQRKLVVAGLVTMQVMMFAFVLYTDMFSTLEDVYRDYFRLVSLITVAPVVAYCAQPFYSNALKAIIGKQLNMDVPVSIAILLAYGASAYGTIIDDGEVYFESVSMFVFFLLTGRFFEQRAHKKAAEISSNLLKLIPKTATLINGEQHTTVPAKKLQPGQRILVKPGEVIPADGLIVNGHSSINEAVLTGEQLPVTKGLDQQVYASTLNIDSPLEIEVTHGAGKQLISEIIRLQDQASKEKPRMAALADRQSQHTVAAVLILALASYLYWSVVDPSQAIWIALAVLVATCPCALALATPTAYTCASAALTTKGLLVRKGDALDSLAKIDHVLFDKTGTLTTGQFKRVDTIAYQHDAHQCLILAASLEKASQHPIANAFSDYFDQTVAVGNLRAVTGAGIEGSIDGKHYSIGSARFTDNEERDHTGKITIHLVCEGQPVADFILSDEIRPAAKSLVNQLTGMKINTTMVTGDNSPHAEFIQQQLAIPTLKKGQTPADKLHYIQQRQSDGEIVCMFGDGVNDAPVLAGAHLSVAMGSGTDLAKSSADLVLLNDHLERFPAALALAKKTSAIIHQNLWWAVGYNLLAVPFAVCGYLPPYLAAIGMSLSSLIVITNSLRLLKG